MIVREATRLDLRQVAERMREADCAEIFAGRYSDDVEDLIRDLDRIRPFATTIKALCRFEWDPVAIVGALRAGPGVLEVLMFATDDFLSIGRAATRWVREVGLPTYVDPYGHRAQCAAGEDNRVSRAWLEALGFEAEGTLRAYGKNGENFVRYARLRSMASSPLGRRPPLPQVSEAAGPFGGPSAGSG